LVVVGLRRHQLIPQEQKEAILYFQQSHQMAEDWVLLRLVEHLMVAMEVLEVARGFLVLPHLHLEQLELQLQTKGKMVGLEQQEHSMEEVEVEAQERLDQTLPILLVVLVVMELHHPSQGHQLFAQEEVEEQDQLRERVDLVEEEMEGREQHREAVVQSILEAEEEEEQTIHLKQERVVRVL
jgi:hypothetical protein